MQIAFKDLNYGDKFTFRNNEYTKQLGDFGTLTLYCETVNKRFQPRKEPVNVQYQKNIVNSNGTQGWIPDEDGNGNLIMVEKVLD